MNLPSLTFSGPVEQPSSQLSGNSLFLRRLLATCLQNRVARRTKPSSEHGLGRDDARLATRALHVGAGPWACGVRPDANCQRLCLGHPTSTTATSRPATSRSRFCFDRDLGTIAGAWCAPGSPAPHPPSKSRLAARLARSAPPGHGEPIRHPLVAGCVDGRIARGLMFRVVQTGAFELFAGQTEFTMGFNRRG